jgi:NAD(P)-dependent dehydrogenase (short-subunit alcohol dehydrogenase family)
MTFDGRATSEEIVQGLDLTGKTIVITGASAGLGFEASRVLAGAGAQIVMAARNPEKNAKAAARIKAAQPGAKLRPVVIDLADMTSVRGAAAEILAAHPRIDALINNAGIMGGPYVTTADGLELHFATNHIGPFLLTNLLVPALAAAAPSRVVMLSSAGHRMPGFDLADLNFTNRDYNYQLAYCQAKRANVLHAVALAKRLAPLGVTANAVHPGAIHTEVFRDLTEAEMQMAFAWSAASGSPEKTLSQGAATEIWAAVSSDLDGVTGQYLEDCQIAQHIPSDVFGAAGVIEEALDPATAELLWEASEKIVGQTFAFD